MAEPDDLDESVEVESDHDPVRPRHFSDMLGLFAPLGLGVRGENAYHAAVKFFELLQTEVPDPEWQTILVKAWISAVKNRNFGRFQKEFRRWRRSLSTDTGTPIDSPPSGDGKGL